MNKYLNYLKKLNFSSYTSLQQEVFLKYNKTSYNIVINSKTGSGKTLCYLIPIIDNILNSNINSKTVIILPTNELIEQVYNVIKSIDDSIKIIFGNNYYDDTIISNEIKKCNSSYILITTPNKFLKYRSHGCGFKDVKNIVFDEADMLFEKDFLSTTLEISSYLKSAKQVIVSATITDSLKPFIKNNFGKYLLFSDVEKFKNQKHILLFSKTKKREEILEELISSINPYHAIVFSSKKNNLELIKNIIEKNDKSYVVVSSDFLKNDRKKVINKINDIKYQYIISTDLLARGIDLDISDVINYDIPRDLSYFIHRSGRTARMNKSGNVYTISLPEDHNKIYSLTKKGIAFKKYNIKNNLLNEEKERKNDNNTSYEKLAMSSIKKPTKVKPNYKKKNKELIRKKVKELKVKDMLKNKRKNKFRDD